MEISYKFNSFHPNGSFLCVRGPERESPVSVLTYQDGCSRDTRVWLHRPYRCGRLGSIVARIFVLKRTRSYLHRTRHWFTLRQLNTRHTMTLRRKRFMLSTSQYWNLQTRILLFKYERWIIFYLKSRIRHNHQPWNPNILESWCQIPCTHQNHSRLCYAAEALSLVLIAVS